MEEKGVHFFGLCRQKGKRDGNWKFYVVGKYKSMLAKFYVFTFGLGPILVDS
jgi:hypothetical protein